MITEQGIVTRVEGGYAWVRCASQAACPRCAEGRGCGGGLIGLMLGTRLHEVRVLCGRTEIVVGQCVSLGIGETALLKYAIATYVLPLLSMLVLAALVTIFLPGSNGVAMIAAVVGLIFGFAIVRLLSNRWRNNRSMQPVLLS